MKRSDADTGKLLTKYIVTYTAVVWAEDEETAAALMLTDAEDWGTEVEEAGDDE